MNNIIEEKKRRNINIEILKIVGAFGIVWFHAEGVQGKSIGYSGLVIFILISIYLSSRITEIQSFIKKRACRILIPWMFWMLFYGIVNILNGKRFIPDYGYILNDLLCGSKIHLWFLPFIYFMTVGYYYCNKLLDRSAISNNSRGIYYGLIGLILILATPIWRNWSLDLYAPWAQWFHAAPAVFIGGYFGYYEKNSNIKNALIISLISLACIYCIILGYEGVGVPYLCGMLLFFFMHNSNRVIQHDSFMLKIAGCTFGVYLLHPFIYSILQKIGITSGYLLILGTVVMAIMLILAIKKIPYPILQKVI